MPAIHLTGFVYFPTSLVQSIGSNNHLLATGCKGFNSNGCDVKIWDLRGGRGGDKASGPPVMQHQLIGHEHDVTGVQFMNEKNTENENQILLSVSRDGYMRRWDGIDGGGEVSTRRFMPSDRSSYTCLDSWQGIFTEDADSWQYCAVGDINGSVHVIDCEGNSVFSTAPGVTD